MDESPQSMATDGAGAAATAAFADIQAAEILDGLGEGFVAFDAQWRITYCNSSALTHFGRARAQLMGKVVWDEVANPPASGVRAFLTEAMAARRPMTFEAPSDLHPGRWISFRVFPLQSGLAVNFRDVTARRAHAARLAELERRRAILLELTDILRPLADPEAILVAAARLLAERLGASRAGYAEISRTGETLIIRGEWSTLDGPPLAGLSLRTESFGQPAAQVLEKGLTLVIRDTEVDPRTAAQSDAFGAMRVRALLSIPVLRAGRLEAFVFASSREPRDWTPDDVTLAEELAGRTFSALVRARSERALRESEARFRAMADSAPAPIWVTSAAGSVEFVNRAFCDLAGKPLEAMIADPWSALLHAEDLAEVARVRSEARRERQPYSFEARFGTADGEWRWMRASCQPRFDAQGVFQGYVGMAMDITAARRAEEHQALLINELNHRVKNTMATVQSLARQTLRDGVAMKDARERFTERLLALSTAHNVLTRHNWESADLAEIAWEAVRPWAPRILLSGPKGEVSPNVALAVSMALHELATNAVKHGALSGAGGRVDIRWEVADGAAALTWTEIGGPPVTPPPMEGRGFGSRLLREGLASDLGAPAEIEYREGGLVCRLRAPLVRSDET